MRVDQVLNVQILISTGEALDFDDALRQAGISKSSYYRYLNQASNVKESLEQAKTQMELTEYADILVAKNLILRQLIKDALNPLTFAGVRLLIYSLLDQKVDQLSERNRPSDVAASFLSGPTLKPGESNFRDLDIQVGDTHITVHRETPTIIEGDWGETEQHP